MVDRLYLKLRAKINPFTLKLLLSDYFMTGTEKKLRTNTPHLSIVLISVGLGGVGKMRQSLTFWGHNYRSRAR